MHPRHLQEPTKIKQHPLGSLAWHTKATKMHQRSITCSQDPLHALKILYMLSSRSVEAASGLLFNFRCLQEQSMTLLDTFHTTRWGLGASKIASRILGHRWMHSRSSNYRQRPDMHPRCLQEPTKIVQHPFGSLAWHIKVSKIHLRSFTCSQHSLHAFKIPLHAVKISWSSQEQSMTLYDTFRTTRWGLGAQDYTTSFRLSWVTHKSF
jgi:hypothetical protein